MTSCVNHLPEKTAWTLAGAVVGCGTAYAAHRFLDWSRIRCAVVATVIPVGTAIASVIYYRDGKRNADSATEATLKIQGAIEDPENVRCKLAGVVLQFAKDFNRLGIQVEWLGDIAADDDLSTQDANQKVLKFSVSSGSKVSEVIWARGIMDNPERALKWFLAFDIAQLEHQGDPLLIISSLLSSQKLPHWDVDQRDTSVFVTDSLTKRFAEMRIDGKAIKLTFHESDGGSKTSAPFTFVLEFARIQGIQALIDTIKAQLD